MIGISVIIPTVRPQNIPQLEEWIRARHGLGDADVEILWEEDKHQVGLGEPIFSIGAPRMVAWLTNKAKHDLVCFIGDDTEPQQDFLKHAYETMQTFEGGWGLVGISDTISTGKATHWLAHKELLNHLENKQFFFEGYTHNFCDDELRVRAGNMDRYKWDSRAIVRHNHPCFGSAPSDEHYERVKPSWEHDKALFEARNCRLSVCMIVKNEEAMLAECLESVKDADEIIIVDTGSTDKTKEIAALYTDKIFEFPWIDDYSAARNFAKSKATGDWILSIDADEVMMEWGIKMLRQGFHTVHDTIKITMDNGAGGMHHVPRVFRNKPSIKWECPIHETINRAGGEDSPIRMVYRRSPAHEKDPDRNLRILEKSHQDDPTNTRVMYYLAREYYYYKRWEDAITLFEKHLKVGAWVPERADAYYHLALCYWNDGKSHGDLARQACANALILNANFKAAARLMADMSFPYNQAPWRAMAESGTNEGLLFIY